MRPKKDPNFKYPDRFWPAFFTFLERHMVYGFVLVILAVIFFTGFKISTKYFSIEKEKNQLLKGERGK
jgi:capsule polysaccharide export protein KpsE/RkpR